jgi:inosine/xanthosine triphosphate pyrophosphatase family protein
MLPFIKRKWKTQMKFNLKRTSKLIILASLLLSTKAFANTCQKLFSEAPYLKELSESIVINSSNTEKYSYILENFLQKDIGVSILKKDVHEIDADPISVAVHKASQFKNIEAIVITEDTALHIEGENIGIHVRWYADRIHEFIGKKAVWQSTMSFLYEGKVYVFSSKVPGKIVSPKREPTSPGFTHYFQPKGANANFNEVRHIVKHNPRLLNALKILKGQYEVHEPIYDWNGPWQKED